MKASRILAGLSAVSIAASMLSMVAASADETEKLTVDEGVAADNFGFDDDGDFTETDNVVDVDADATTGVADADKKGGNKMTSFAGYPWYKNTAPFTSSKLSFPGWPGWGVTAFPSGWEWFEGIKSLKDKTWEVFGTKDLDVAAPGYLVFEFENGKKWLVPASVDENGQFVTDEAYIPYMNVTKIYFLYEVSESPYFKLDVDKFTVNGKDVELNKDNWKDEVKYVKVTSDGDVFLLDRTNNSINAYEREVLAVALKNVFTFLTDAQKTELEEKHNIKLTDEWIDNEVKNFTNDEVEELQAIFLQFGIDLNFAWAYDADGNLIANGIDEEAPIYYQATIFDKNAKADSIVNHGLVLWGTKVSVTFTVDGIGKIPVHDGVFNGDGDDKAKPHAQVDPLTQPNADKNTSNTLGINEATGKVASPINAMFNPANEHCSADLYDQLVQVYASDPDHKADAEIKFKTVADKGGVLVANFINVWEEDGKNWLKDFDNRHLPIYAKKVKILIETRTPKKEKRTVPVYDLDANGAIQYDDQGRPKFKQENGKWATQNVELPCDGVTKYWYSADYANTDNYPHEETMPERYDTKTEKVEHWVVADKDGNAFTSLADIEKYYGKSKADLIQGNTWPDWVRDISEEIGADDGKSYFAYRTWPNDQGVLQFIGDDKVEVSWAWHAYFVTENGLVDVITKDYLGNYKTNVPNYIGLSDSQIKYLKDNNGMYYNDNLHDKAYGHFVVFGDNTEREYSYRIKADAVKAILEKVQRSTVNREDFVQRHGSSDIDGFSKDYESYYYAEQYWLENDGSKVANQWEHKRAVHGAIWLQSCEGTYLRDVRVHAHTDLLLENDVPKVLYNKENYDALYPTKPAESAASSAAAAQPTAAEAAADENAGSGAAAGFGIAGLLLAGAAMVCAKKKDR